MREKLFIPHNMRRELAGELSLIPEVAGQVVDMASKMGEEGEKLFSRYLKRMSLSETDLGKNLVPAWFVDDPLWQIFGTQLLGTVATELKKRGILFTRADLICICYSLANLLMNGEYSKS